MAVEDSAPVQQSKAALIEASISGLDSAVSDVEYFESKVKGNLTGGLSKKEAAPSRSISDLISELPSILNTFKERLSKAKEPIEESLF